MVSENTIPASQVPNQSRFKAHIEKQDGFVKAMWCGETEWEEGTKPRKVLMSMEQFEQYIEEYL